jgi:hypothetical protein
MSVRAQNRDADPVGEFYRTLFYFLLFIARCWLNRSIEQSIYPLALRVSGSYGAWDAGTADCVVCGVFGFLLVCRLVVGGFGITNLFVLYCVLFYLFLCLVYCGVVGSTGREVARVLPAVMEG